jgi:endonuclease YncB( thermonuclease family)
MRRWMMRCTRAVTLGMVVMGLLWWGHGGALSEAHRSGCHRWHACPSDRGTYTCGDLGHCSQCPDHAYGQAGQPRAAAPRTPPAATPPPLTSPQATPLQTARVVQIIDGDTIDVEIEGQRERVRYIGINTPETKHPTRGIEPYGPEAAEANTRLVAGHTVRLELDVERRDRDGRLVASVSVGDTMINAELVRQGYAQVATFPPNVKYQELFLKLQREAREAKCGLWGTK